MPYEARTETLSGLVTYENFDATFEVPVNIINVRVVATPEEQIIWSKTVADRFIRSGIRRNRSFDERVVKAFDRAQAMAHAMNIAEQCQTQQLLWPTKMAMVA